ncbi:MAG: photosystem II protein Psb27 [Coleofasciculaceae cyanobacterium]
MLMKRYLSPLIALVLVVVVSLMGCSSSSVAGLTGDYRQDTAVLLKSMRAAIELPKDAPETAEVQQEARQTINDYASRYRRDSSVAALSSFTTMRTALNSLAGHYSSYPNRPLPEKLKTRLEQEFRQVESALNRNS